MRVDNLYRTPKHRRAGMSFTFCRMLLDDLMADIEFYDMHAPDPLALIQEWNELCMKDCPKGQRINELEAEILIEEMRNFDVRFQVYFANVHWKMVQGL